MPPPPFSSFKRLPQAFAAGSCWRQDTGLQRCWPNPAQPPFHGASCSCSLGSEASNCPHLPQKGPKPQHRLPGGGQGTQQPRGTASAGGSRQPLPAWVSALPLSLPRAGTRSHARTPALPLGPAPPLLFLVPLVLWLSPGAPQTLPLCLNAHRVLPCPRLQEKKREVNLASCRHRGAARAPRAAARAKAGKKKPETKSREGCRPSMSDGHGSSRRTGIDELQLLGHEDRKSNREPAAEVEGSAERASRWAGNHGTPAG